MLALLKVESLAQLPEGNLAQRASTEVQEDRDGIASGSDSSHFALVEAVTREDGHQLRWLDESLQTCVLGSAKAVQGHSCTTFIIAILLRKVRLIVS